MLYLPITKNWIISRNAKIVYLVCAVMACMLFGALFAILAAMAFSGIESLAAFPPVLRIAVAILLPGVIATAILTVAMWYFWFGFDKSSWIKRAVWFLPLYFLPPVGPVLYCFAVYLRDPQLTPLSGHGASKAFALPEQVS